MLNYNPYFSIGDAVAGLGIFLLIPQFLKPIYIFRLRVIGIGLRSLYANDEFLQFENGTTGIKNFAFTLFSSSYRLCVPPVEILNAFDQRISPIFDKRQGCALESETLSALRDTLLPKLISGELRVKDAERLVSEAA